MVASHLEGFDSTPSGCEFPRRIAFFVALHITRILPPPKTDTAGGPQNDGFGKTQNDGFGKGNWTL